MPEWLNDAVFYEIYPQSFYDSNGDGIGDINGIREKIPYIKSLGVNALWINPCYDSPFKDAGYDVRDYKKIAPRYGSNDDMAELFKEAHSAGIRVLLDLVPGHTSEEHEWFRRSSETTKNEYSNRYIWTEHAFDGGFPFNYVAGETERPGAYILNFFKCQPALNYGFGERTSSWQLPPDHPDCIATREAIKDVMRFWLDMGCDGFRVDMADSLVKNDDENKSNTCAVWQDIRQMLDREYPNAAIVSEWDNADQSMNAGFHMDFTLNNGGTGYSTLFRDYINHGEWLTAGCKEGPDADFGAKEGDGEEKRLEILSERDKSFFRKDAGGDISLFLKDYESRLASARGRGYVSLITGNHDTPRLNFLMDDRERRLAFAFILTMPGVPFIYYGDEIGMRYFDGMRSKEGGFHRTGSRTPMQWDETENLGFSTADKSLLYLPVDPASDHVTVASSEDDPDSLLNFVRSLIDLRHSTPDLMASGEYHTVHGEKGDSVYIYRRGSFLIAINTSGREARTLIPETESESLSGNQIFNVGEASLDGSVIVTGPQSFTVFE